MRAFICASVILGVMIVMIIGGAYFNLTSLDAIIPLCEAAKGSPAALEALELRWQDCRDIISLSVYRDELERVERALTAAKSFIATSEPDYLAALDELEAALEHIRESQGLSFSNIF